MDYYVLYKSPRDFPGKFVLRRWFFIGKRFSFTVVKHPPAVVSDSPVECFKRMKEQGRYLFVAADKNDDPVIVGTFL